MFQAKETASAKALWHLLGAHVHHLTDERPDCGPPPIADDEEGEDQSGHVACLRLQSYLMAKQRLEPARTRMRKALGTKLKGGYQKSQ